MILTGDQAQAQRERTEALASVKPGEVWLIAGQEKETETILAGATRHLSAKNTVVVPVDCTHSANIPAAIAQAIQIHFPGLREEAARVLARIRQQGNYLLMTMPDLAEKHGAVAVESVRKLLLQLNHREKAVLALKGIAPQDAGSWLVLKTLLEQPFHKLSSLGRQEAHRIPALWVSIDGSKGELEQASNHLGNGRGIYKLETAETVTERVRKVLADPDIIEGLASFCGGDTAILRSWLKAPPQDAVSWFQEQAGGLTAEGRTVLRLLQMSDESPRLSALTVSTGLSALEVRRAVKELRDKDLIHGPAGLQLTAGARNIPLGTIEDAAERETILTAAQHLATAWQLDQEQVDLQRAVQLYLLAGNAEEARRLGADLIDLYLRGDMPQQGLNLMRLLLEQLPPEQISPQWHLRKVELLQQVGEAEEARATAKAHLRNVEFDIPELTLRHAHILKAFGWFPPLVELSLSGQASKAQREQLQELRSEAYQALGDTRRALKILRGLPTSGARSVAMGNIYFLQGDEELAEPLYRSALTEVNEVSRMRALHNLGLISMRQAKYAQAERELRSALELSESSEEYFGAALCKVNLAFVLEQQERFRPAKEFLLEAIELFSRHNRVRNLCGAMTALGDLYRRFGAYSDSKRVLNEAQNLARESGLVRERADAQMKLGAVETERGKWGAAEQHLTESFPVLRDSGHPEEASKALVLLAECALERGERALAQQWVDQCEHFPVRASSERLSELSWLKGQLCLPENPGTAAAQGEQAMSYGRRSGQTEPQVRALHLLETAFRALEREDDAQQALKDGKHLFEHLNTQIDSDFAERFRNRGIFRHIVTTRPKGTAVSQEKIRSRAPHVSIDKPKGFEQFVGESPALLKVLNEATKLAQTDADLMLRGASGTGKEMLASAIVAGSKRSNQPFIRINAAALTDQLLQSELFGHMKGSFTGAHKTTRGKLEEAHTGTLFLDEVGELSPKAQVMLLRALQERTFQKVGSAQEVSVDVRFLFATNADLEDHVKKGLFREDLYHRICGLQLRLPALRERRTDIPALASAFLDECNRKSETTVAFADSVLQQLEQGEWPGNIRQLRHRVKRAFLLRDGNTLEANTFTLSMNPGINQGQKDIPQELLAEGRTLDATLIGVEKHLIAQTLKNTRGNISRAARILGMSRPRLSQKVKEYGLKKGVNHEY